MEQNTVEWKHGQSFESFIEQWRKYIVPIGMSVMLEFSHEMAQAFGLLGLQIHVKNFHTKDEVVTVLHQRQDSNTVGDYPEILKSDGHGHVDLVKTMAYMAERLTIYQAERKQRALIQLEEDNWDCAAPPTNEEVKVTAAKRHRGYNPDDINRRRKAQWKSDNFAPGKKRR